MGHIRNFFSILEATAYLRGIFGSYFSLSCVAAWDMVDTGERKIRTKLRPEEMYFLPL